MRVCCTEEGRNILAVAGPLLLRGGELVLAVGFRSLHHLGGDQNMVAQQSREFLTRLGAVLGFDGIADIVLVSEQTTGNCVDVGKIS